MGARPGVLNPWQLFQPPIFSLNNDKICVQTHVLIDHLLNYGTQLLEKNMLYIVIKRMLFP